MELVFDLDALRNLLVHLFSDRKDGSLRFSNSSFVTSADDIGNVAVVGRFIDVDLRAGVVLDLVDRRAAPAEDARDAACGNRELDRVVRLLLKLESL